MFPKRSLAKTTLDAGMAKKLQNEFKQKVKTIKAEMIEEQKEQIVKQSEEDEEVKLTAKVDKARETSLMAIQKEEKLEQLMEKEEESKEEEDVEELTQQVEQEKHKEECLMKAIKEKQLEDQFNIAKTKTDETIKKIAEQTKKEILIKRLQIKKKIAEMRKRNERRKSALRSQIMNIRTVVAQKIGLAAKVGNIDKCFNPSERNIMVANKYCDENFAMDYNKYSECNQESSFCYICCENEFGDLHLAERDKCYNKCDGRI